MLAFWMRNVAHMQHQVRRQHFFQCCAERRHQLRGQVTDEPHRVREDHFRPVVGQFHRPHGRVQCGKQHIFCHHIRACDAVEKRRFSSVGIANQRDDRKRHFGTRLTVQLAGLHHFGQLSPQPHQMVVNCPPVSLNLGFTGTTHKPKTTTLALQVGPSPHQSRALIRQRCHFHLQNTFARTSAIGEDLEDQPGPVQKFDLPLFLKIALLHRSHRPVNQDKLNLIGFKKRFQLCNLARPKKRAGLRPRQTHHV
mmetsp:Transcript_7251/g.12139  ORF Transcript_7251/g.12139 Transcript_7251/m.12139 type:complete len:252 (-) Transcript_7251:1058-1813(-)